MRLHKKNDNRKNVSSNYSKVLYTVERTPVSQKNYDLSKKKQSIATEVLKDAANAAYTRLHKAKRKGSYPPRRKKNFIADKRRANKKMHLAFSVSQYKQKAESFFRKTPSKITYAVIGIAMALFLSVATVVAAGAFSPAEHKVTINDAGRVIYADTKAETVRDLFSRNGIIIEKNDVVEASLDAPVEEGMNIIIRRAASLIVTDGKESKTIKMLAGTVEEALSLAGITLGSKDEVYPAKDTYISEGMTINVIRVEVAYETVKKEILYQEITKKSDQITTGERILMQQGKNGEKEEKIEIVYKNGEEYSREVVESTVISEPVNEVVYIGTYVAPTPTPEPKQTQAPQKTQSPQKTKNPSPTKTKKPEKEDVGSDLPQDTDGNLTKVPSVSQLHSGTWAEHKSVAAPASSIIEKVVIANTITAYTHTGNKTATGTWPKIGTLACNPKQIPYGTKLYIPGYGYARVEDTGSNKHAADEIFIDVFFESESECRTWGRKRDIKVYILKD